MAMEMITVVLANTRVLNVGLNLINVWTAMINFTFDRH